MKSALEQIVNTVLYEGCMLDPHHASSKKNQRERFTFGRVYPTAFSEKENGTKSCAMQTECLVRTSGEQTRLKIAFEFLQPVMRNIRLMEKVPGKDAEIGAVHYQDVPHLDVPGELLQKLTEAIERKVLTGVRDFSQAANLSFTFPLTESREEIGKDEGKIAGIVMRRHEFIEGRIEARFTELEKGLFRISVRVVNLSGIEPMDLNVRENVLLRTFASSHFTLELENGQFLSMLETPPECKAYAEECNNVGCWPVLVGDKAADQRQTMLASPIFLYDYPEIAVETAREFVDGTEIDEMLALRVDELERSNTKAAA